MTEATTAAVETVVVAAAVGLAAATKAVAVRAVGLVAERGGWREGSPEVDVGRGVDSRAKRTANGAGGSTHTAQMRSSCVG